MVEADLDDEEEEEDGEEGEEKGPGDGVKEKAAIGDAEREGVGEKGKDKEEKGEKQESEFSNWFWVHRGENYRAWKRRKREVGKERRAKERKERKG